MSEPCPITRKEFDALHDDVTDALQRGANAGSNIDVLWRHVRALEARQCRLLELLKRERDYRQELWVPGQPRFANQYDLLTLARLLIRGLSEDETETEDDEDEAPDAP